MSEFELHASVLSHNSGPESLISELDPDSDNDMLIIGVVLQYTIYRLMGRRITIFKVFKLKRTV